jgi:hypothetical protein
MIPTLPGSLPTWITPGRIVVVAQLLGLSFVGVLASAGLSLSVGSGLFLGGVSALFFFSLAWITRGQSSWIAVAASYGEIGAWLGSLVSTAFFAYLFASDARPHQTTAFFFAAICTGLLGWLPGLLVGLGVSALFWGLGGWLLAPLHQHKIFPAHDDVHQHLFRAGGWLWVLGLLGLWVAPSPLLWVAGLELSLFGVALGVLGFLGLRRRARWLRAVRAGRIPRWALLPATSFSLPLRPLSNRHTQGLLLVYRAREATPYRTNEEELPIALC